MKAKSIKYIQKSAFYHVTFYDNAFLLTENSIYLEPAEKVKLAT